MATVLQAVSTTAVDLVTGASLVAGTTYLIQNVGGRRAVIAELDSAPTENGGGHALVKNEFMQIKPPASGSIYAWTTGGTTTLAISEAA